MSTEAPKEPQELIVPLAMIDSTHPAFGLSGRVADGWAIFEHHVDRTIWRMAALNDGAGACITAQIFSLFSRLRALKALVELAGGSKELVDELNSIAGRSDPLGEERNRIVHDPWMMNLTKRTMGKLRITAKNKLHFDYIPVPLAEIESLLSKIKSHQERFSKFEDRLWAELAPLIDKSRVPPPENPPPSPHP